MPDTYRQPLGEATLRQLFGAPCDETSFDVFDLPIVGRRQCHKLVGPQLRRIFAAIQNDGLSEHVWADQFGCFNCRTKRGGTSYSSHAWAVAVDLNTTEQADGSRGTAINFQKRGEFPHLRRLLPYFLSEGFACGIQWKTVPDPMHFEARTAQGTGLLASGTLRGVDLDELDGLTDEDRAYLRGYAEYAVPEPERRWILPSGEAVPFEMREGRAVVLVADVVRGMRWSLDTGDWPTMRSGQGL